ncbi:MAG: PqqD family peptide modification chaperone [Thiohalocapsa sp.]|jgi:hypothetical protein|uniref:PqqD family peptide modification chaperone n=1 Tax=Thiohalocapsa sp. TaxID=2497641 RepID=UPI0025FCABC7|nr:PqqD family peptide modification chaperone [Thiohalocapsa sp.]MCG6941457.1 PqqD family peptide modification chaperone [Thiohalocapsa sp.]
MNTSGSTPIANLTLETVVRQHPDLVAADADGEVLMMHVDSGNYFGLNEVASFVWYQLELPRTVGDLCSRIRLEFDVEEERCIMDLLAHLRDSIADGLVEVVSSEDQSAATQD